MPARKQGGPGAELLKQFRLTDSVPDPAKDRVLVTIGGEAERIPVHNLPVLIDDAMLDGVDADAAFNFVTGVISGTEEGGTLQAYIDSCLYLGRASGIARLPVGVIRVGRGLHFRYGTSFVGGRMTGAARGYQSNASAASAIICDFQREPGLSIQGARGVTLEHFSLWGKSWKYITDNGLGSSNPALDDSVRANWLDTSVYTYGLEQRAPDCGIAIDPRTLTTAAGATHKWTDVDYPAFLGVVAQNNKGASSGVKLADMEVVGFPVGVYVGAGGRQNGDFVTLHKMMVHYCPVGVAFGQDQLRNSFLYDLIGTAHHTAIDNRSFGEQQGTYRGSFNGHWGNTFQLFDLGDTSRGPIHHVGDYVESTYILGTVNQSSDSGKGITLEQGDYQFQHQWWNWDGLASPPTRGAWPYALKNTGSGKLPLSFAKGKMTVGFPQNFPGISFADVEANGTRLDWLSSPSAPDKAERIFRNGLAGGWIFPSLGQGVRNRRFQPEFAPYDIDGGNIQRPRTLSADFPSSRVLCTPLWTSSHFPVSEPFEPPVWLPERAGVIAYSDLTSVAIDGRTLTATLPSQFTDDYCVQRGCDVGDVLLHDASNTAWVITARASRVITAKCHTNWKPDGVTAGSATWNADWVAGGSLFTLRDLTGISLSGGGSFTSGNFYYANLRYYSPSFALYGKFTSGSNVIDMAGNRAGGAGFVTSEIKNGDMIYLEPHNAKYFSDGATVLYHKISARAATGGSGGVGGTITIDANAAADSDGRVRIGTLIRGAG